MGDLFVSVIQEESDTRPDPIGRDNNRASPSPLTTPTFPPPLPRRKYRLNDTQYDLTDPSTA